MSILNFLHILVSKVHFIKKKIVLTLMELNLTRRIKL